jgi:hypothetical protein
MPRARRLSKADIQARIEVFRPYSDAAIAAEVGGASYVLKQADAAQREVAAKIATVAKKSAIPVARRTRFAAEVELAWGRYLLESLVEQQEHPARAVATLRPGLAQAQHLRSWLQSLPPFLRSPLMAGEAGLAVLIDTMKAELASWRKSARAGRPPSSAAVHLRQGLRATFEACGPECPRSHDAWRADRPKQTGLRRRGRKPVRVRCCESCLNRWTALALDVLGVAHSDLKKNPRRFRRG